MSFAEELKAPKKLKYQDGKLDLVDLKVTSNVLCGAMLSHCKYLYMRIRQISYHRLQKLFLKENIASSVQQIDYVITDGVITNGSFGNIPFARSKFMHNVK